METFINSSKKYVEYDGRYEDLRKRDYLYKLTDGLGFCLEYLTSEKIVILCSGFKESTYRPRQRPKGVKSLYNLLFPLRVRKVTLDRPDGAMKTLFLKKHLRFLVEKMLKI